LSNSQIANEPSHFIEAVEIRGSLSFDRTKPFRLNSLKRINIFIGENSSGKSNIIRAIIGFRPDNRDYDFISVKFFGGDSLNHALNDQTDDSYGQKRYNFFEIPPFRTLVIPKEQSLCERNERSGLLDLREIENRKEDFYKCLRKIIGVRGFELKIDSSEQRLCCPGSDAHFFLDNGRLYIRRDRYTNWGKYSMEGVDDDIPIDLLGWGTKSIIILYYNLFFYPKSIVFIEEPEISTHPKLLKNLFEWAFKNRPDCQFFITTHSSLLLDKVFLGRDGEDVQLFQVYKEGTFTKANLLNDEISNIKVIEQLGFQASNLLFTNYVIWVEGPSDIFYYEAFLNMASFLCSGSVGIRRRIHYEIMWYGGSMEGRLIDIESEKELSILFSFTRRGAIFWDYDKDYVRGSDKQAPKDTHKKILEYSNRKDLEGRFIVGCTGEILKDNIYSGNELPLAIENLSPKAICGEFVESKRKSKSKTIFPAIFEKLSQNKELTKGEKSTFNGHKINLSRAFLKKVNELIKETKTNEIEEILLGPPFDDIKATFFGELLKEIKKANE
jgi:hypothetical protein